MKRIIIISAAIMTLCSCEHDIARKMDFNITLNPQNTYYAGEPVRFDFDGEIDNLIVYTGDESHEYRYKDRTHVEAVIEEMTLNLKLKGRYGRGNSAMDIWISNTFPGLKGNDAKSDKETIAALTASEDAMTSAGWEKIEWVEEHDVWKTITMPLDQTKYADGISLAFHWSNLDCSKTQGTYYINGNLLVKNDVTDDEEINLKEMGLVTFMTNDAYSDPYLNNKNNGYMNTNKSDGHLVCQGVSGNVLEYEIDGWAFTTPKSFKGLTVEVESDTPHYVKTVEDKLSGYEYTWDKSGTYEVTFIGSNSSYQSHEDFIKKITVTIIDKF